MFIIIFFSYIRSVSKIMKGIRKMSVERHSCLFRNRNFEITKNDTFSISYTKVLKIKNYRFFVTTSTFGSQSIGLEKTKHNRTRFLLNLLRNSSKKFFLLNLILQIINIVYEYRCIKTYRFLWFRPEHVSDGAPISFWPN